MRARTWCLVNHHEVGGRLLHAGAAVRPRPKRLNRRNLHRLFRAWRDAGLDDAGVDPLLVQLADGLLHQLAPVHEHQDALATGNGEADQRHRDYRLAGTGRRDHQHAPGGRGGYLLDALDQVDLIRAQRNLRGRRSNARFGGYQPTFVYTLCRPALPGGARHFRRPRWSKCAGNCGRIR